MTLLAQSGLQTMAPSADQLVVFYPHSRSAVILCLAALAGAVALFLRSRAAPAASWTRTGAGLLFFLALFAGWQAIDAGRFTLDKSAGTVSVEKTGGFGLSSHASYPIAEVRYAEVRSAGNSRKLCLVLRGGDCVSFSIYTQMPGQYAAADKINEFLGVSSPGR